MSPEAWPEESDGGVAVTVNFRVRLFASAEIFTRYWPTLTGFEPKSFFTVIVYVP